MSSMVGAAINGQAAYSGKAYFFNGGSYVRYDWNPAEVDAGYPRPLSEWGLPGQFLPGIDAALSGAGKYKGKGYFFRSGQYVRYDWTIGKVDPGYPQDLSAWKIT